MHKAYYTDEIQKLATVSQASERYKIGRTKLMEIAGEVGAVRRIGRMVRIDIPVMDKGLDNYQ